MRHREAGLGCLATSVLITLIAVIAAMSLLARAEEPVKGNMVFFKGGFVGLNSNRSNEIFTDTLGATGRNDSQLGWYVGPVSTSCSRERCGA